MNGRGRRVCKLCGAPFAPTGPDQQCCPDCRAKHHALPRTERACPDCGRTFSALPRQRRCPDCQRAVEAARDRERKLLGPARPIGSTDTCARCGKPYVVHGGLQRYCAECGPVARQENAREKARERIRAKALAGVPGAKRVPLYVCTYCGATFRARIGNASTCSPECALLRTKAVRAKADAKRRAKTRENRKETQR